MGSHSSMFSKANAVIESSNRIFQGLSLQVSQQIGRGRVYLLSPYVHRETICDNLSWTTSSLSSRADIRPGRWKQSQGLQVKSGVFSMFLIFIELCIGLKPFSMQELLLKQNN
jgi:hypothetical protein